MGKILRAVGGLVLAAFVGALTLQLQSHILQWLDRGEEVVGDLLAAAPASLPAPVAPTVRAPTPRTRPVYAEVAAGGFDECLEQFGVTRADLPGMGLTEEEAAAILADVGCHVQPVREAPPGGGHLYLSADGAVMSEASPGCTVGTYSSATGPVRALNCTPGSGLALWQLPWSVGEKFTYRVHYLAPADATACDWNVAALPVNDAAVVSVSLKQDSTTPSACSLRSLEIVY